jgi:hypothetical protein
MTNKKTTSGGACALPPQHLLPVENARRLPICPARTHAFRLSQVMFFGHGLPLDYYRHR